MILCPCPVAMKEMVSPLYSQMERSTFFNCHAKMLQWIYVDVDPGLFSGGRLERKHKVQPVQ